MEDKAENLIRKKTYLIYLMGFIIISALPLLNLPPWFSPPDWGKTIIFRIILAILIFIFLWQTISNKKFSIKTSLPFWLLIVLFGIFLLATLFSLDIHFSFWGSPSRSGGFLNFAFYIIFAILAFLIIEPRDWRKIWDFSFIIGIFVSIIAIFQQLNIFSDIFVSFFYRPASTIGGPIFLAIYLLLLSFLALSFGIKERILLKKIFYFVSLLLFLFVIFLTWTRAAFIGILIGFLFFIFFYPRRLIWLKISFGIILIFGLFTVYYLNTISQLPEFISNNKFLRDPLDAIGRLSLERALQDPRISAWKVSLMVLEDRPFLGYGPENFSIGFDKYYDPVLPGIEKMPGANMSWWDRAHNFIFDIGVTAGIPALIIHLSLFGIIFWQLQKLKKGSEYKIIIHGIQATLIAYLVANFFSFDTFSTYLISFLLIGYSLHLISLNSAEKTFAIGSLSKYCYIIISVFLLLLIWFIWSFNLKPLQINKEANLAIYESEKGYCENALNRMEKILPTKIYLDGYLRLKYVGVIGECINEKPEITNVLASRAAEILKENIKIMPYYTRNWILLGNYTNILIEAGRIDLKNEADSYFERAYTLSPKRQEVFIGWAKTYFLSGDYEEAEKKSRECVNLNEKGEECWQILEASNISLKDFSDLIGIYQRLISFEPANTQYYAYLALSYKEIGDYKKARETALKILEITPEAKTDVDKFLEELP